MKGLINLFSALYFISVNSKKHEVVLDEETIKSVLYTLKSLQTI